MKTIVNRIFKPYKEQFAFQKKRKVFSDLQIDKGITKVALGVNILLAFDRKKGKVYRCALNSFGELAVLNNFSFLKRNCKDFFPKAQELWQHKEGVISAETLMYGRKLTADDITPSAVAGMLEQLKLFYSATYVKKSFDFVSWQKGYGQLLNLYQPLWLTKLSEIQKAIESRLEYLNKGSSREVVYVGIHGDLTFRNILQNDGRFIYLDFDRAMLNFPQFDIFLLFSDAYTYKNSAITYAVFFSNLIAFAKGKTDFGINDSLYEVFPLLKENREIEPDIRWLFLYQMLILILQSFRLTDKKALILLDYIAQKLKE